MEPRIVRCAECDARLRLPETFAGRRFKCARCGAINSLDPANGSARAELELEKIPAPPRPAERPAPRPSAPAAAPPRPSPYGARSARTADLAGLHQAMSAANKSARRPLRWVFLLAIVPLAYHVFFAKPALDPAKVQAAFNEKLNARLADRPELRDRIEKLGDTASLELLAAWSEAFASARFNDALEKLRPFLDKMSEGDRSEILDELKTTFMEAHCGLKPPPFLSKDSWGHWGLAGLSALAFLSYFCFAYPRGNATVKQLLPVGIFTGTIGILLLLAAQFLAALATGFRVVGFGLLMLIWLILNAIHYSYSAADNPDNGFILSFLGFTVGVGLLEELCKQLPLIWHFRHGGELDWRGACVWGLASGAGFGVAEGVMYSAREYNGSASLEMYLVRFISCVAMHAAWAGSAAILLCRRQGDLHGELDKSDWLRVLAPVLIGPMILHGLYDTLLKKGMDPWALLAGAASFVFFIWLQEREARNETGRSLRLMGLAR